MHPTLLLNIPRFSNLPPSLRWLSVPSISIAFKSLVCYCELDLTLGELRGKTEIRNFHFHAKVIVIHLAAAVSCFFDVVDVRVRGKKHILHTQKPFKSKAVIKIGFLWVQTQTGTSSFQFRKWVCQYIPKTYANIKKMMLSIKEESETQIFIETPYRNQILLNELIFLKKRLVLDGNLSFIFI